MCVCNFLLLIESSPQHISCYHYVLPITHKNIVQFSIVVPRDLGCCCNYTFECIVFISILCLVFQWIDAPRQGTLIYNPLSCYPYSAIYYRDLSSDDNVRLLLKLLFE